MLQRLQAINFNKLIYGDQHIFGYPAAGTMQTVAAITMDDLKTLLQQLFLTFCCIISCSW